MKVDNNKTAASLETKTVTFSMFSDCNVLSIL